KTKIFIFFLIFVFGFSDFISFLPEAVRDNHLAEKFIINKAQAATVTYSIPWALGAEGFVWVIESCSGTCTQGFIAADGNPAGSMFAKIAGRNKRSVGYWKKSLTWEDMGVPAGAAVTGVDGRFDVRIAQETNPAAHSVGLKIFDSTDAITVLSGGAADAETEFDPNSSSWITRNIDGTKTIDPAYQSSNTSVTIRMREYVNSGNSAVASSEVRVDNAAFVITYTITGPNATSFVNNTDGALLDGGRSSQQITVTGTNFGAGPSNGTTNAVKIGIYIVPNGNVAIWNATTIVFTIPAAATVYGGAGANGLIIRAGGVDDATPLDFYIYPNIISISLNSGQIGSNIIILGDHFGASAGAIAVNTKTAATVGAWSETSLTARIPGQEGPLNITGKIQIARSDAKTSNQYPVAGSFAILAPSVSGSNPSSATTGQTVAIEFSGLGIDTDTGIAPALKLTKTGQTDIIGTSMAKVVDYQAVSANFNLSGAVTGYWKLVVANMDGQSGSYGDEATAGFNITSLAPTVTGINPGFGNDSGIINIFSITGTNFQSDAIAKLTKTAQADIVPSTAFAYAGSTALSSGAFDLSGKANGWWNVVVVNVGAGTSGSYGNEVDAGFEIRSAKPSTPANIYQFKINTDIAQPPTINIAVGGGIGGQNNIYFRMDMSGGLTGELYYPQIELKPIGAAFTDAFIEGAGVMFNSTAVQGWASVNGVDGNSYHWQARVRNSAGASDWAPFGGNNDPNDIDIYVDNTPPTIDYADCTAAAPVSSITDLSALIQWNTSDNMSGAQSVFPGAGAYAKVQVDYKKGVEFWTTTPLSAWENSLHQVALSALAPATNYTFRMRSRDYLGNEAISSECGFLTTSSRPIKTVEFFIAQEMDSYKTLTDGTSKKYFIISLPESPSDNISVKSAFIEITGVTSAALSQTIKVGLLRGDQTSGLGPAGKTYELNSDSTTTPFTILFDTLAPIEGDNENMTDITTGATPYDYTLFLKGDGITDIWLFSAKLIITYSYAQ
ncbi:IPT/TIG domain-containing protein, partial [Candidatus Parcubacteria bacterium]|nr:IPT/TIG domain-containing protein [Candidatus Parcubacteria bacterium]